MPPNTTIRLALGFAALGGYCDAVSFFLVGTFTGHVTGNSVLAAGRLAVFDGRGALACSLAIVFVLVGTAMGARFVGRMEKRGERFALQVTVAVEALLLALGYLVLGTAMEFRNEWYIAAVALAMGLQNGAFRRANGLTVHTTYVSGMFTNLISGFAGTSPVRADEPARGKILAESRLFGGIFVFFVGGAIVGAVAANRFRESAVLGGILLLVMLMIILWRGRAD